MEWPQAKYANSGDVHVAYWIVGGGPVDVVFVPEWITFIEALWSVPSYERLWERLGSFGRLILTDARAVALRTQRPSRTEPPSNTQSTTWSRCWTPSVLLGRS